jgi:c-di-GMP-binding flagellar brake protein YcgR
VRRRTLANRRTTSFKRRKPVPKPFAAPESAQSDPVFSERRQHLRRSVTLYVRYRRIDPHDLAACQQEYRHGVCRNISDGGMLLEIEGHIPRGQVLEVYAADRGADATLFGVVETVRAVRTPDRYEIGVRFLRRETI